MRNKIFSYVKKQYDTDPEYLWSSNPDYAVLRHRRNRKWYGIVMDVQKSKLGLPDEGRVWVINVKTTSAVIEDIPDSPGFLPRYHMNKKYWLSILLDGTVPEKVVQQFIDTSYELTRDKERSR